jgi:hypothetical protein
MNGQWIGTFDGGRIVVNIDEIGDHYEGVAYLIENQKDLPQSVAFFGTTIKDKDFKCRTNLIQPIDPATEMAATWETVAHKFPSSVVFSKYADVTGSWDQSNLTLSWNTDTGVTGHAVLPRSKAAQPSDLVALNKSWTEFKEYVSTLRGRKFLFRGQNGTWRLRTSFHRTGRADLVRFLVQDIPQLHKHLSAKTKHIFNLQLPDENGSFFNLVQHHGYPTPLLDWTYSPFVAAFFAYRGISNEKADAAGPDDKVRIVVFDQELWRNNWRQISMFIFPGLHVSVGEYMAIENERLVPQQAATTITNVDDIETYIRSKESDTVKYLSAIDLPIRDRRQVVRELSYMGITAGSLFPGLDGACEELALRNFDL